MARQPVTVAFSCTENFLPHTGTAIASLLLNADANRAIEIVVLAQGLRELEHTRLDSLTRLHRHSSIRIVDMSGEFDFASRHDNYGPVNYFRCRLPSLLADCDRVLYLDSDLVVLGDISPLFDLALDGYPIAACEDLGMKALLRSDERARAILRKDRLGEYLVNTVGMRAETLDTYFNTGVMLMDLEVLRRDGYESRFVECLQQNRGYFLLVDQDMLNGIFQGAYKRIGFEWNFMTPLIGAMPLIPPETRAAYEAAARDPRIIHYIGHQNKPWRYPDSDFAHHYKYYLRQTPWYETILEGYLLNSESMRLVMSTQMDAIKVMAATMVAEELQALVKSDALKDVAKSQARFIVERALKREADRRFRARLSRFARAPLQTITRRIKALLP